MTVEEVGGMGEGGGGGERGREGEEVMRAPHGECKLREYGDICDIAGFRIRVQVQFGVVFLLRRQAEDILSQDLVFCDVKFRDVNRLFCVCFRFSKAYGLSPSVASFISQTRPRNGNREEI